MLLNQSVSKHPLRACYKGDTPDEHPRRKNKRLIAGFRTGGARDRLANV